MFARAGRWLLKNARWENVVVAAIAAAIAYQLFVEPLVGLADNSDWWRVLKQVGLDYGAPADLFFNFPRTFKPVPVEHVDYLTSQLLLTKLAIFLDDLFSSDATFDLRWMGFVNAAAYVAAIRVFLGAFRRRAAWQRITLGVIAAALFTDVRIVEYMSSFYCEPAQLTFLLFALGFAFRVLEREEPRARWVSYGLFVVSATLCFFAKAQNLVFCVPLAGVAVVCFPRERAWLQRMVVPALFGVMMVWGLQSDAYAVTRNVNVQVHLDEELLPHSPNPAQDLRVLGRGDRAKVTLGRIARFYMKRPARWWSLATRRFHQAFDNSKLGNFEHPGRGQSLAFDELSNWKLRHYPRSLVLWIVAIAGYLAMLAVKARKGTVQDLRWSALNALLVLGCILQFVAVVTFEANGTEKHLFIFNALVDLALVLAIFEISVLVRLARAVRSSRARAQPR